MADHKNNEETSLKRVRKDLKVSHVPNLPHGRPIFPLRRKIRTLLKFYIAAKNVRYYINPLARLKGALKFFS